MHTTDSHALLVLRSSCSEQFLCVVYYYTLLWGLHDLRRATFVPYMIKKSIIDL